MLLWNAFIEQARDIVCFERPLRSLKWVLVLYLLGLVGGCLSGITVLYLRTSACDLRRCSIDLANLSSHLVVSFE